MGRENSIEITGDAIMLVRYFNNQGKFLEEAIVKDILKKGQQLVLADGKKYKINTIASFTVDCQKNVIFQPVLVKQL
jgi:hypothetical protein